MTRSALRRTAVSFLFLLLSLTTLATAAPVRLAAGPPAGTVKGQSIVSFFWTQMIRLWEKEGGSLDPSGKQQATNPRLNEGSSLDPSGFLRDNGGLARPERRAVTSLYPRVRRRFPRLQPPFPRVR